MFFVLFCFVFSSEYESMNKPQDFFSHTGTIYDFTGNFMMEVEQIPNYGVTNSYHLVYGHRYVQ